MQTMPHPWAVPTAFGWCRVLWLMRLGALRWPPDLPPPAVTGAGQPHAEGAGKKPGGPGPHLRGEEISSGRSQINWADRPEEG